jgi:TRAP transporter TAXI family solute receptor
VLFPTVVHIAVRRGVGIRAVRDLKGRRVFVGEAGSPTEGASRVVLQSHGLTFDDLQPFFDRNGVIDGFRAGRLDGVIFFFPIEHASAVAMMRGGDAQLVPLDPRMMEAIRSRDPLLKPASIPGSTYEGQAEPVLTVGTDVLLVSRSDLSEDLVYTLTRTLFESVGRLRRAHRSAAFIDPSRGPGAPIPLHRGAARYYRERELFR